MKVFRGFKSHSFLQIESVMLHHLKRLECDEHSTIDDIKKQYRLLSKKYHPDLSGADTSELFIELTKSYEWLIVNHKPRPTINKDGIRLYRVLEGEGPYKIEIDKDTPRDKGITVYCMLDMKEFRLIIDSNVELPGTVKVSNVTRRPFDIRLVLI